MRVGLLTTRIASTLTPPVRVVLWLVGVPIRSALALRGHARSHHWHWQDVLALRGHARSHTTGIRMCWRQGVVLGHTTGIGRMCWRPVQLTCMHPPIHRRLPIRSGCAGAKWTGGVFPSNAAAGLPLNETTMPQALKAAGYATGMIGKWYVVPLHAQTPAYCAACGFRTDTQCHHVVASPASSFLVGAVVCRQCGHGQAPLQHN